MASALKPWYTYIDRLKIDRWYDRWLDRRIGGLTDEERTDQLIRRGRFAPKVRLDRRAESYDVHGDGPNPCGSKLYPRTRATHALLGSRNQFCARRILFLLYPRSLRIKYLYT